MGSLHRPVGRPCWSSRTNTPSWPTTSPKPSPTPTPSADAAAVAVTLIAATQRPTQKAVGQGALRSQMDVRVCFRVRERRDVDLILGQGCGRPCAPLPRKACA